MNAAALLVALIIWPTPNDARFLHSIHATESACISVLLDLAMDGFCAAQYRPMRPVSRPPDLITELRK